MATEMGSLSEKAEHFIKLFSEEKAAMNMRRDTTFKHGQLGLNGTSLPNLPRGLMEDNERTGLPNLPRSLMEDRERTSLPNLPRGPMEDNKRTRVSRFHVRPLEQQLPQWHGTMDAHANRLPAKLPQGQMPQQHGYAEATSVQYEQRAAMNLPLANAHTAHCYFNGGGQWNNATPYNPFNPVQFSQMAYQPFATAPAASGQATTPEPVLRVRNLARWQKPSYIKEAGVDLMETTAVIEEHRTKINDVLRNVYNNGLQTAGQAIFQRLILEVQMTHSLFGLPLKPPEERRTVSNIWSLSKIMSGLFTQPKDLSAEAAEIWAEVDKARTATLSTDIHAGGRTSHQNGNQNTTENSEAATPSRPVPAQNSNTKPVQKRSTKPIQESGKASSSKANGKDERQFTLTGVKRILVNNGGQCTSYFCSDGQWRVLQDGPLEEAQKRTEALKASSGVETKKTSSKRTNEAGDDRKTKRAKSKMQEMTPPTTASSKRMNEAGDDRQTKRAKKAKLKAQEMTPPTTATNSSSPGSQDLFTSFSDANQIFTPPATVKNSSSPDDQSVFTNLAAANLMFNPPMAVKSSPSPDGQSLLTVPAAGDQIDAPQTAENDSFPPDGQSRLTVPANGNQIAAEAQYTQAPLSLQEAKENYKSNFCMIANAPQDFFVQEVPPIPPISDAEEFADLLWLGRQMDGIHSSFD